MKTILTNDLIRKCASIAVFVLIGLVHVDLGQSINQTQNKADQTFRSKARVNPSTLGMEFSIPISSYAGRAGHGKSFSLDYSSKVWGTWPPDVWFTPIGTQVTDVRPQFAEWSVRGWKTSMGIPRLEFPQDVYYDDGRLWAGEPNVATYYIKRVKVFMPDGAAYDLRQDDNLHPFAPGTPFDWNGVYLAVDGSKTRLEITGSVGILYLPDGGRFILNGSSTDYVDPHGNKMTHVWSTQEWTDTLGRVLKDPVPLGSQPVEGTQEYQFPGLNGQNREVEFVWAKLSTQHSPPVYASKRRCVSFMDMNPPPGSTILFTVSGIPTNACEPFLNRFDPVLLTEVRLPNGSAYKFHYNVYGEIDKIEYPTGGYERFEYAQIAPVQSAGDAGYDQFNRGVKKRWISSDGTTGSEVLWQFDVTRVNQPPNDYYKIRTTAPDNTYSEKFLFDQDSDAQSPFGFGNIAIGRVYEENSYSSAGQLLTRKLGNYARTGPLSGGYASATRDLRLEKEISIVFEPGNSNALASFNETVYDTSGNADPAYFSSTNPKQTKKFNYVVVGASAATIANVATAAGWFAGLNASVNTEMDYIYDPNYKARNIMGLIAETRIKDANQVVVAKSQTGYDDPTYLEGVLVTNAPGWVDPQTTFRGLPTLSRIWTDVAANQYIEANTLYDQFGNVRKTWDPNDNVSEMQYSDSYSDSVNRNSYAFATKTISPTPGGNGSTSAFDSTVKYDFNTGLPLSTTDPNNLETRIEYDTPTLRPRFTKTYYLGAQVGAVVESVYHDELNNSWVNTRTQIDEDKWEEYITHFDGIGRVWKTEKVDSLGNILVEKEFDLQGRVKRVTNPFRSGETKKWTTNVYDEASRLKDVIMPDGSTVTTTYGLSAAGAVGVTKQVTDPAIKKQKAISDAFGRPIRVIEDPDGQNLITDSVFDTVGNLRKTIQDGQSRYFMYDSLGRLTYAKQPEQDVNTAFVATDPITNNSQWSAKYEYDNNGNIARMTDARGVYIQGTYDALDRLTLRDYSDTTPDVSFYYDGMGLDSIPAFSKKKTTKVTSSISESRYTGFDSLGRLLSSEQRTPFSDTETIATATPRVSNYQYNLSGELISQTYPSGRVVKNTLNSDGDLAQTQSRKNLNYGYHTYASSFSYDSAGAIKKAQLGNGRWETASYNDRLQTTQIGLGVTNATQDILKLDYEYGSLNPGTGQVTALTNNGSVGKQKITVPGSGKAAGFTAQQYYVYDSLNRLQITAENIENPNEQIQFSWRQQFEYDRYGNRRFDPANTTTLGSCTQAVCNPLISTANNRFSAGQGYSYDATGNLTVDAQGRQFFYDAENQQKQVKDAANNVIGTYLYDGEGKRVKKVTSTETTVFVYDGGGQLVAEYSTEIAQTPQVSYLTTDHLGSPRVITNENGVVTKRRDHTAFGEESAGTHRAIGLGYGSAQQLRTGFTGYGKDPESGLDFAEARYFNALHGRFTSVDPFNGSGTTGNPQSLNRYAYVTNDPINFVDPSGMAECSAEHSYSACGGDAGFWGGRFGDEVAADTLYYGGLPAHLRSEGMTLYLQRVTNAQNGNGFRTSAEVLQELAVAFFDIHWAGYDDGSYKAWFEQGAVTVNTPAPPYWHQVGVAGKIGDFFRSAANNLTLGLVDYVDREWHQMDQAEIDRSNNSTAGRAGDSFGMVLGIVVPGPGKIKTLMLATRARTANRGLAVGERFLRKGYTEIAPGVFRSKDKLRQFRMTDSDILNKNPHFNFEVFSPNNLRTPIKNYHMPIK